MLEISKIRIDGGTQMRVKLDEATVLRYMELMKDGVAFRPIDVFFDGTDYWLTDGFHRREATERLKLEKISTDITNDSLDNAIWDAAGANTQNGLSFTAADRKNTLNKILLKFTDRSDSMIAEHVGVSRNTVAAHRKELIQAAKIAQPEARIGADGKSYSTPAQPSSKSKVTSKPDAIGEIPMGDPPAPKAPAAPPPPAEPPAPFLDMAGHDLNALNCDKKETILDAFRRRGEIVAMMTAMTKIKKKVLDGLAFGDHLYAAYYQVEFEAAMFNALAHLSANAPYSRCSSCGGDGCKLCKGRGWLGRQVYQQQEEYHHRKDKITDQDGDE
jgi:hypothetical protein